MEQIGDAFWNFAWAFVDVLEAILIWLQGVLGELYTLVCELFKIRFQFRIFVTYHYASHCNDITHSVNCWEVCCKGCKKGGEGKRIKRF